MTIDKRELTDMIARETCLRLATLRTAMKRHKQRDANVTPLDTWAFASTIVDRVLISYELKRRPPTPHHGGGIP